MPSHFQVLFCLLCLILLTTAEDPDDPYFLASGFPRPESPQFKSFFPKYAGRLKYASRTTCNQTFNDYQAAYAAPPSSTQARKLLSICYQHETCLLEVLPPAIAANFQSAGVVLGLMPTLLSTIAPSLAELALLSVHRPVLGLLIALGAPGTWPSRLMEYNDPSRVVSGSGKSVRGTLLVVRMPERWRWAVWPISVLQYVLAAGAVGNVFWTSIDLGRKSVLSWGCTTTFGPLLWTSLAGIVHIVATLSFAFARRAQRGLGKTYKISGSQEIGTDGTDGSKWGLVTLLRKETMLCCQRPLLGYEKDARIPMWAVLGNVIAGCGGFIHLVFGIIIFSSLQLVSVWDVLNYVLSRYIASAVVCRLILLFEIGGLRRESL